MNRSEESGHWHLLVPRGLSDLVWSFVIRHSSFQLAVTLLLALCPLPSHGAAAPAPQTLLDAWRARQLAGAVAAALVTSNGTRFFFAGSLTGSNGASPDADTYFEIGSITKGFTGLLLADQVLAGRVKPDDTLAELLTDWPARKQSPAAGVTLEALATHRSGLTRLPANMGRLWLMTRSGNPYADYDVRLLYQWLDDTRPAKGTNGPAAYEYSNAGFAVLGHALAVRAGTNYEALLRHRILEPLELTNTFFRLTPTQRLRLAPGHNGAKPASNWDFQVFASAGGLRSTAREMARFLEIICGLRPNPREKACALAFAEKAPAWRQMDIGYGWHRLSRDRGVLVWHNGGTGGYHSFLGWYPEHRAGIAVLAAIANDCDALAMAMLDTQVPLANRQGGSGRNGL